jgi:hypothetical protein
MNIFEASQDFEQWLAKRLPVVRRDVALKHALMAQAPFPFFRATFYLWLNDGTKPAKKSQEPRSF